MEPREQVVEDTSRKCWCLLERDITKPVGHGGPGGIEVRGFKVSIDQMDHNGQTDPRLGTTIMCIKGEVIVSDGRDTESETNLYGVRSIFNLAIDSR